MSAARSAIAKVVRDSLDVAVPAIDSIQFAIKSAATRMLDDLPRFAQLRLGTAESVWAAILFVDLRGSTERARRVGARDTYLTMHALLPALAFVTGEHAGFIAGFRGDGLFAAFGLTQSGVNPDELDRGWQVQQAAICGQTMVQAVREVVNLTLQEYGVPADLRIGVGVDCGQVVITRIGLMEGHETTAYGDAVNTSAKLSSADGVIFLSQSAYSVYPSGPGGLVTFEADVINGTTGYRPNFPASFLGD